MLLGTETLDLGQCAKRLVEGDHDGEFAARTAWEIVQSEIERQTPICATISDAGGRASAIALGTSMSVRQPTLAPRGEGGRRQPGAARRRTPPR
jgi:hypothetical protein